METAMDKQIVHSSFKHMDVVEASGATNNTTSLTTGAHSEDWAVRLVFVVFMIIFSIAGFFGNVLIAVTIVLIRGLRNTRNIFLVNLAVSDLILIAVVVPFNIMSVIHGAPYWKDKVSLCLVVASVCAPGCLAAIWSNTAVAVNRLVFICHNEIYDTLFSRARSLLWIAAVWTIAFAIHFPNHVGWGHNGYVEQFFLCTRETNLWTYSLFFGAVGIVLPLIISFYSYCRIYNLVRSSKSARNTITKTRQGTPGSSVALALEPSAVLGSRLDQTAAGETRLSPGVTTKTATGRVALHQELLLVRTLFRSFAVFLVAWLPLAILLMVPMNKVPTWIYLTTVFLAHGSTATNSLMYFLTNESFRRGFGKLLRRTCRQSSSYLPPSVGLTERLQPPV